MKSIVVFTFCLALGLSGLTAEPLKEGKKEGKKGRAAQAEKVQAKAGKHGRVTRQSSEGSAQISGGRAKEKGAKRRFSSEQQGNVPAVQSKARGGKASVRRFDFANRSNAKIKSVTFSQNRRIVGAENWHGERYVVFRNYRPLWHDRGWWVTHYPRVVFVFGGWYYWNSGFWYPAWGYDPAHVYYPYDGPIYGYNDLPPDQVVANVQAELQDQGYYRGEVDGLLGPLTRAALADYQRDHGLYTTAAIDQPTMESLGFS